MGDVVVSPAQLCSCDRRYCSGNTRSIWLAVVPHLGEDDPFPRARWVAPARQSGGSHPLASTALQPARRICEYVPGGLSALRTSRDVPAKLHSAEILRAYSSGHGNVARVLEGWRCTVRLVRCTARVSFLRTVLRAGRCSLSFWRTRGL